MSSTESSRSPSLADEFQFVELTAEPMVTDTEPTQDQQLPTPSTNRPRRAKSITVDGIKCLNLNTHDYLGIVDHPRLLEGFLDAASKYGVVSWDSRTFYEPMDVHFKLEEQIATFLGVQEAVLYSYASSTITSAIPAYAKSQDILLVDEQCNFAIQQGVVAAKSKVVKFAHNQPEDLEEKVKATLEGLKEAKSKKISIFIIVEGIYANTGQLCKLKQFIEIAKRFKIRLLLDESCSFGVLGSEGKGITQELGIDINDVDLIMSSLEGALCGFGGFCAGSSFAFDNHRIVGSGHYFSGPPPPLQTRVALESLALIREDPSILRSARDIFKYANEEFKNLTHLENTSDPLSPIKLLSVKKQYCEDEEDEEDLLDYICDTMLNVDRIALSIPKYMDHEKMSPPMPSIRLILNGSITERDIGLIFMSLESICLSFFSS